VQPPRASENLLSKPHPCGSIATPPRLPPTSRKSPDIRRQQRLGQPRKDMSPIIWEDTDLPTRWAADLQLPSSFDPALCFAGILQPDRSCLCLSPLALTQCASGLSIYWFPSYRHSLRSPPFVSILSHDGSPSSNTILCCLAKGDTSDTRSQLRSQRFPPWTDARLLASPPNKRMV